MARLLLPAPASPWPAPARPGGLASGSLDWAEAELRKLIRRYPLFADARAALSGLLWREGSGGEPKATGPRRQAGSAIARPTGWAVRRCTAADGGSDGVPGLGGVLR